MLTSASANPPSLLLDTNVWLDVFLPRRPGQDLALLLLDEAQARGIALTFPSHGILDVYQKVRSDNKRWIRETRALTQLDALAVKRLAWDCVASMRAMATPVPVDTNDLALACKFRDRHDDLEGDLVLAACQRARVNYLVTTDRDLISHAPLEAKTPGEMVELLRSGRAKGTPAVRDAAGETEWLYRWLASYEAAEGASAE